MTLKYVSTIRPNDQVAEGTVAANIEVAPNMYVITLTDGRSFVPMRGDHKYGVR